MAAQLEMAEGQWPRAGAGAAGMLRGAGGRPASKASKNHGKPSKHVTKHRLLALDPRAPRPCKHNPKMPPRKRGRAPIEQQQTQQYANDGLGLDFDEEEEEAGQEWDEEGLSPGGKHFKCARGHALGLAVMLLS